MPLDLDTFFGQRLEKKPAKLEAEKQLEYHSLENVLERRREKLNRRQESLRKWISTLHKFEATSADLHSNLQGTLNTMQKKKG